jgi:hypothetical protein
MKLKNGIDIVSLEDRLARVRLSSPIGAADIRFDAKLPDKFREIMRSSQWSVGGRNDNFNFRTVSDILPKDEDYIAVNFRALSKTVVPGHWIDWTKDNVLEQSTPLLLGATVYPNHEFWDINNWLGSVSQSAWDAAGANSQGVPGINAEYKIDALMNPRIARGLLMSPPAIHSTSMTVLFEFEYSHPDMAAENKYKFLNNLGEDVDGEIVRFIVTNIREYWEASLVFQGADRFAKKYDDPEQDQEEDFANMSAKPDKTAAEIQPPPNSNEEKTMKLTNEQKQELGIEFDGEDVPETEIFKAAQSLAAKTKQFDGVNIAELTEQAKAGVGFIAKQRAEVTRLAKLAELGSKEGELEEVVSQTIQSADFDRLVMLEKYYSKKVAERFPESARSSHEDPAAVEAAGGVKPNTTVPKKVGLH